MYGFTTTPVADAAEQRLRRACESLGGSTTKAT